MRNYKYFWSLLPGLTVIFGNLAGGWWGVSNFVFSLGILAFIEWFFPEDKSNEVDSASLIPDVILCLHAIVQPVALCTLFYAIHQNSFSAIQLVLACISTGIHSGTSTIVIAHELIHRKQPGWKLTGKFLLLTAGNLYFYIQHLRVHHKYVGTAIDPATARFNESLYSFVVRTTAGQLAGTWKLEKERLNKTGRSAFNPGNYIVGSSLLLGILFTALWYFLGWIAVAAFAGQCLVANFLLEYTNYIEHYGLTRLENERVTEVHSWQSDKAISRFILIDLSRHSDHHYYASKPYHELLTYEKSPVLPGGSASAIYLAVIPQIWFRIMNPRIKKFIEERSH